MKDTTLAITCAINQAEAIRRGYASASTARLEIDLTTLTDRQKGILADSFKDGKLVTGYSKHIENPLPEPTTEALLAAIDQAIATQDKKAASLAEERKLASLAAEAQFTRRQTGAVTVIVAAGPYGTSGTTEVENQYLVAPEVRGTAQYQSLIPDKGTLSCLARNHFDELLKTPDGIAWLAELQAVNTASHEAARNQAIADSIEKQNHLAQKKATAQKNHELLHSWALANGSETLRLRTEENLQWENLAIQEYARDILTQNGFTDEPLTTDDKLDCEFVDFTEPDPTSESILKLRDIRRALASSPGSECSLIAVRYSNPDDEDENFTRLEIQAKIKALGQSITLYFTA